MPALRLKLAGSLLAGALAGVAALATLTSSTSPRLSPAGDSTPTSTQQVVESPAPCPSGTIQHGDSCDFVVPVQQARVPATEPATEPTEDATDEPQDDTATQPATAAVPTEDANDNGQEDADHEDATEVEQQGDHEDGDHQSGQEQGSEHESGD